MYAFIVLLFGASQATSPAISRNSCPSQHPVSKAGPTPAPSLAPRGAQTPPAGRRSPRVRQRPGGSGTSCRLPASSHPAAQRQGGMQACACEQGASEPQARGAGAGRARPSSPHVQAGSAAAQARAWHAPAGCTRCAGRRPGSGSPPPPCTADTPGSAPGFAHPPTVAPADRPKR